MTTAILIVIAVYVAVFVVSYGLARLVQWAGHALPEWLDTDDDEIEAAMRRHPAGKQRDAK